MSVKKAKPRILCVDDEPELLSGVRLVLRKRFDVETAESGPEGLALLETAQADPVTSFDAVVSDMRMPKMSGAEFLATVRERYPTLPRLLLSGQSDLDAAIAAINEAKIFRFLTKPCPPPVLMEALDEAIEQARLRNVERELLDRTLKGTVDLLTNIVGLVSADASNRASRITSIVHRMCSALDRPVPWSLDLAAMLSQIGFVVIPATTEGSAKDLTARRVQLASELLGNVPRLHVVAELIRRQHEPTPIRLDEQPDDWPSQDLNHEILRLAVRLDDLVAGGKTKSEAVASIKGDLVPPPGFLLDVLGLFDDAPAQERQELTVRQLKPGMTVETEIFLKTGPMLASPGVELTEELITRIRSFARTAGVVEPIAVLVPIDEL